MINDIIFDFGKVLVEFEPMYMTSFYVENEEDCKTVSEAVFDRKYWDKLDDGTITHSEIIEALKKRLPNRLFGAAEKTLENWIDHLPEMDGMRALLEKLRALPGIHLYLLSNISREFAEVSGNVDILKYFDGCVFSAVCGYVKPSREIFAHLCEKFGIKAENAVFVDDSEKNINGAKAFGLNTVLFKNAEETERALKALGIEI